MNNKLACLITTLCLTASLPLYADKVESDDPNTMCKTCELAWRYYNGDGVEKDYVEAVRLFRKAADNGDPYAMYNLGCCYEAGDGVNKNIAEAVKWYRKAADNGDTDAMCKLSSCYLNGNGVEMDYTEAAKWLKKAAENGFKRRE